jgi:TonB family protein
VQVTKPGFARLEQKGIEVSATEPTRISIVLNVGKVQETLTVSAQGSRPAALPGGAGEPKPIRVGGSVQATKLESMVQPQYPADCKAEGVEGTVLLRGFIGRNGNLLNLEPINKLVDQRLVNAAIDAVRQWRYRPTLLNGEPVEVVTEIQVNFILDKQYVTGQKVPPSRR